MKCVRADTRRAVFQNKGNFRISTLIATIRPPLSTPFSVLLFGCLPVGSTEIPAPSAHTRSFSLKEFASEPDLWVNIVRTFSIRRSEGVPRPDE